MRKKSLSNLKRQSKDLMMLKPKRRMLGANTEKFMRSYSPLKNQVKKIRMKSKWPKKH